MNGNVTFVVFWRRLAGKVVATLAFCWYCLRGNPPYPAWVRVLIGLAILYVVVPYDIVRADRFFIGWFDDLGVLALALLVSLCATAASVRAVAAARADRIVNG